MSDLERGRPLLSASFKEVVDNVFGIFSGRLTVSLRVFPKVGGGALFDHDQAHRRFLTVGGLGDIVDQHEKQSPIGDSAVMRLDALSRVTEVEPVKKVFRLRPDGTMRCGPVDLVVHDHPQMFGGMRFITDSEYQIACENGFTPHEIAQGLSGAPEVVVPVPPKSVHFRESGEIVGGAA